MYCFTLAQSTRSVHLLLLLNLNILYATLEISTLMNLTLLLSSDDGKPQTIFFHFIFTLIIPEITFHISANALQPNNMCSVVSISPQARHFSVQFFNHFDNTLPQGKILCRTLKLNSDTFAMSNSMTYC